MEIISSQLIIRMLTVVLLYTSRNYLTSIRHNMFYTFFQHFPRFSVYIIIHTWFLQKCFWELYTLYYSFFLFFSLSSDTKPLIIYNSIRFSYSWTVVRGFNNHALFVTKSGLCPYLGTYKHIKSLNTLFCM